MTTIEQAFRDPQAVEKYAEGPPRFVPGHAGLLRMATLLLAEYAPQAARVLVLGAGGGLELRTFAEAHADWQFDGIDPSAEMLALAERTLGPLATRARLHEGYIDDAPEGPFDAASCLLTLHFLGREERLRTVTEVLRRLRPGAPFAVAHCSIPGGERERALWLSRYVNFAVASGVSAEKAENAGAAIDGNLEILTPEEDQDILRDAGFSDVCLFFAGFTFRGWVAYA